MRMAGSGDCGAEDDDVIMNPQPRMICLLVPLSVRPSVFLTLGYGCCIDSSTDDNFKLARRPLNIQTVISPPGSRPPPASYSRSHHQTTKKNRNKNKILCHMFDKTESFTDLVQCWIFNVFKRLLYICNSIVFFSARNSGHKNNYDLMQKVPKKVFEQKIQ